MSGWLASVSVASAMPSARAGGRSPPEFAGYRAPPVPPVAEYSSTPGGNYGTNDALLQWRRVDAFVELKVLLICRNVRAFLWHLGSNKEGQLLLSQDGSSKEEI